MAAASSAAPATAARSGPPGSVPEPALSARAVERKVERTIKVASVAKPVPVSVLVRPFGWVQVDDGTRTEERSLHQLSLPPGPHRIRIGCDYCVPTDEQVVITTGGDNTLNFPVTLKGALVRFEVDPPTAQVKVGDEVRSAQQSLANPFLISPRRDPHKLKHQVDYELSAPGYQTVRATVEVDPGKTTTVPRKLARQ